MSSEPDQSKIEERIRRAVDIKDRLDSVVDMVVDLAENPDKLKQMLPDRLMSKIPDQVFPEDGLSINPDHVQKLKEFILSDEELQKAQDGWEKRRPIRFLVMGEQGVGKSSFINALAGEYVAKVGTEPGRESIEHDAYDIDGRKSMEIIDSRGLADLDREDEKSAYENLVDAVQEREPDAVILLVQAGREAHLEENLQRLEQLQEDVELTFPTIAVANQVDRLEPDHEQDPEEFSEKKVVRIAHAENLVRKAAEGLDVNLIDVVGVQSKIIWDGEPNDDGSNWSELDVDWDRRYNIDHVRDIIAENVDLEAGIHFLLQTKAERSLNLFGRQIVKGFARIGGFLAGAVPIPLADMAVLFPLEITMLLVVAYLGGRDVNWESPVKNAGLIKEFIGSLGVVAVLGLLAKTAADELPDIIPVLGAPTDMVMTFSTVYVMGMAGVAYFVNDVRDSAGLRKIMREEARHAKELAHQVLDMANKVGRRG